jgi:hypothetical protein
VAPWGHSRRPRTRACRLRGPWTAAIPPIVNFRPLIRPVLCGPSGVLAPWGHCISPPTLAPGLPCPWTAGHSGTDFFLKISLCQQGVLGGRPPPVTFEDPRRQCARTPAVNVRAPPAPTGRPGGWAGRAGRAPPIDIRDLARREPRPSPRVAALAPRGHEPQLPYLRPRPSAQTRGTVLCEFTYHIVYIQAPVRRTDTSKPSMYGEREL